MLFFRAHGLLFFPSVSGTSSRRTGSLSLRLRFSAVGFCGLCLRLCVVGFCGLCLRLRAVSLCGLCLRLCAVSFCGLCLRFCAVGFCGFDLRFFLGFLRRDLRDHRLHLIRNVFLSFFYHFSV